MPQTPLEKVDYWPLVSTVGYSIQSCWLLQFLLKPLKIKQISSASAYHNNFFFRFFVKFLFRLQNNGYSYKSFIKLTPKECWSGQPKIVRKRFSIHVVSSFAVAFGLVVYLFSIFLFLAD